MNPYYRRLCTFKLQELNSLYLKLQENFSHIPQSINSGRGFHDSVQFSLNLKNQPYQILVF